MVKPNWAVSKAQQGASTVANFSGGLGNCAGNVRGSDFPYQRLGSQASISVGGEALGLKTSDAAHAKIRSMRATLGDPFTRIVSPQAGHCQSVRAVGLSVPRNGFIVRVESQLRAAGFSDGASEGSGEVWCGLCGDRRGWCTCGRCMGEGGFPTRPGLAGVKGKVGWARCRTCFGQKVVPCLFCGISEAPKWKLWLENARRHPHRSHKQWKT